VVGCRLEDLHLGENPVRSAMAARRAADAELGRAEAHIRLRVVPLVREGRTLAGLCLVRDVSELRERERLISVKDAAIREVHHRVKNNLQTIASLLRLQGRRLDSAEAKAALEESVLRIGSIALVHETLSEDTSGAVEFADVARRIAGMVAEGLLPSENRIAIEVRGRAGALPSSLATPLAVTLTELLQNALEHGFSDGRPGTVTVQLRQDERAVAMSVCDDGVGIAPGSIGGRLGLHIVRSLTAELGGRLELTSNGGTRAEVRLPLPA
jgi:two-component sensor histidine kinase